MFDRLSHSAIACLIVVMAALSLVANPAYAQTSPEALVRDLSSKVIEAVKNDSSPQQSGVSHLVEQVEATVMPAIDFQTVTRSAVGPRWREATTEQRQRLQEEFKTLLTTFYAGGIRQIGDYAVEVTETVPVPNRATQVIVRSRVAGAGQTHQLDYRLDKAGEDWKIVDLSLDGIWVTLSYRSQFAEHLAKGGIDGLIEALAAQNRKGRRS
ncbi:ABC transporter substrate-binding protein [Pseudomonas amygdali]|uniref:MlaC/ttg2D family ABC transporter substrate-binding protein n=1 Tax=Pseudomonas amygdali TaxID=47877 RepID=UPI001CD858AA|nr:ABC transporter substrate-binding protein [Pseudomonas amygdali]UBT80463.1 ABC transporter substrate-binding protein [Pseudomonas amygdali]